MRLRPTLFASLTVLLAPFAFGQSASPTFTPEEIKQGYSSRSVLAKPRDGVTADALTRAESAGGASLRRKLRSPTGVRLLEVAAGETVQQSIERLRASGNYDYVEHDYIVKADATPNDPRFLAGDQWALRNLGQSGGKAGADIKAEAAWDIQSSASGVIVAVLDSGIRVTHEDLATSLWTNPGEAGSRGQNNSDDDANGYIDDVNGINSTIPLNALGNGSPIDAAGHGTAVASVIAGAGNNALGMTGVAWNANLMALRFLDASGFGLISDEVECIDYAIAKKAQVINASFGGSAFSQTLFSALKRARDVGIIVVCSAGNDAENNDLVPHYPSSYLLDNIVAVAASTRTDDLASYSDYGAGLIDLAAPGSSILCASAASNNGYQTLSGTSFSAPMVSGAIALLRAKFPNDNHRETINRLLRSVDVLPAFNGKVSTGGRLNLAAALGSTNTRPFNDDFAKRGIITGENVFARGASQGSTREVGETVHGGTAGNGSLWWSWTAPRAGAVTLTTEGSAIDTLVEVYTGAALGALTSVAKNDDESASLKTSKLTFTVTAGTTYQIAIDNKNNDGGGLIAFTLSLLSNNDNFDSAQLVSGRSWNVAGDNRSATRESKEPTILNNAGGHSLWYKWVAPATRNYHLSSFSADFNTMVAIYTGTSIAAGLDEVKASVTDGDSNYTQSSAGFTFKATAGTAYYIAIDSEVSSTGSSTAGTFTLSCIDSEWVFFGNGPLNTVAFAPSGVLHAVDDFGYLYAINPDGSRKWRYTLSGYGTFSSPAVAADGTIYVGDDYPAVYAINPDGTRKWAFTLTGTTTVQASPAIASDGTIYFRPEGTKLYAFNPSGTLKWSSVIGSTTSSSSTSSPVVAPDGTIYCATANSRLVAVNPDSGSIKWTFTTDFMNASPAIGADGTVYIGVYAPTRRFYALKPADGSIKWEFIAGDSVSSSAAIGPDGAIYFGCSDKNLYALNPDGSLRWTFPTGNAIKFSSPVVAADGSITIGSYDGKVYCVEPEGTLRRVYATSSTVNSSPIINNGRLYITSGDYRLYSVDTGQVPASTNWPMGRQNLRRSGRFEDNTLAFGVQPTSVTVAVEEKAVFSAGAVGQAPLTYQWSYNGQAISGATAATYVVNPVYHSNGGKYSVKVTDNTKATITSNDATLTISTPLVQPTVLTAPVAQTILNGSGATLSVVASGSAPFTYQWLRDGAPIAGATSATISLTNLHPADTAKYSVTITNFGGSVTSTPVSVTVNSISRISNLSVLTTLSGAGDAFTLGYVVGGARTSGTKPLVIRAAGPALGALGVGGTLDDPKIELFAGSAKTSENDNWGGGSDLSAAFTSVGAFPFATAASKDAAVSTSLTTRDNSVKVSVAGSGTGLVIAEVYDASADVNFVTSTPRLVNVSVLKEVGTGLTVGFTVAGSTPKTVLIRAVGPTLGTFGVGGTLADPQLVLFNSTSVKINENNDWGGGAALKDAFDSVGAFGFAATSKDAALVATLPPGGYSVQVSGINNTTGVALVEVYEVP
jgi:subtilisin family serine protease/outer membrane protein assembly factor BamB